MLAFDILEIPEWVARLLYDAGYVILVLAGLLGFIGTVALYWGDKAKSRYSDKEIQTLQTDAAKANASAAIANKEAEQAKLDAAKANESAAHLSERAATLEKEAATARLELAKIDPMNAPIKSVRVELFLEVRGVKSDNPFLPRPGTPPMFASAFLSLIRDGKSALSVDCVSFDTLALRKGGGPLLSTPIILGLPPNCRIFNIAFEWPSNRSANSIFGPSWIENTNATSSDFDKNISSVEIAIGALANKDKTIEFVASSCAVILNGSIRREFVFFEQVEEGISEGELVFCPKGR